MPVNKITYKLVKIMDAIIKKPSKIHLKWLKNELSISHLSHGIVKSSKTDPIPSYPMGWDGKPMGS